jgi:hypothetical protein
VTRLAKIGGVVAALVAMMVFVLVAVDVVQDRKLKVSITGAVPLYPEWDAGPRYQSEIGEIGPSTSTKVLRVRYGKAFEAIKVRTDAGETGWVFTDASVHLIAEVRIARSLFAPGRV